MPKLARRFFNTQTFTWTILILSGFLITSSDLFAAEPVFLGVLENFPQQGSLDDVSAQKRPKNEPGKTFDYTIPADTSVRICFKKVNGEWQTGEHPAEVSWTIAFDGRNLGEIKSKDPKDPKDAAYYKIGRQELAPNQSVPAVGKPSHQFSAGDNRKSLRPLVAVSQPNFLDPEKWKPSKLTTSQQQIIFSRFREQNPKVTNCKNPEDNVGYVWKYQDSDVKIKKVYASTLNWVAAEVQLTGCHCDWYGDMTEYDTQWYVLSPDQKVRLLSNGLVLLDAGDYDNDGKSELIFEIDRENRGGYEIYYDNFEKHTVFEYGYH